MVAQDQVDPVGILAFQGRDQVDELVRLVAPVVGIHPRPVDQLLQDEVPPGISSRAAICEHLAERGDIAVEVADDHHVFGRLERDDPARRPGVAGTERSRGGRWRGVSRGRAWDRGPRPSRAEGDRLTCPEASF